MGFKVTARAYCKQSKYQLGRNSMNGAVFSTHIDFAPLAHWLYHKVNLSSHIMAHSEGMTRH